ncbi:MAG: GTPase ObgE [Deltaproteobacteria bacterium]|nr:GTPase ObgE [Deltaproteobacteria bacterium]
MFDWAEIMVKAGDGGRGAVSFRHEKFVPFGGPDGGDGGKGGDVVIVADEAVSNLRTFRRKRNYKAARGKDGAGKKKHGRNGADMVLAVPPGTVVSHKSQIGDTSLIADLDQPGQRAVVAKGGRGGKGNTHFATSTNQAPQIAQQGEAGGELDLILELKLIADVGLIGYPNAGKSTLLSAVSAANPKIAGYPFTTREPILGVLEIGPKSFVLAEIPGLIEDAHLGRGLGHDFLRHVERTRVLIHLVDGSSASPAADMAQVNIELSLFDSALGRKPQLVVVNKIDLPQVEARLAEITASFKDIGTHVFFVSAVSGRGLPELMAEAMKLLQSVPAAEAGIRVPRKIFHPPPKSAPPGVHKEGDIFVVTAPALERIITRPDDTGSQLPGEFRQQLARLGVTKALERAGIKLGDRVRCGNFEWEWP